MKRNPKRSRKSKRNEKRRRRSSSTRSSSQASSVRFEAELNASFLEFALQSAAHKQERGWVCCIIWSSTVMSDCSVDQVVFNMWNNASSASVYNVLIKL